MPPSSTTGGGPTLEVIHENAGLRCFVRLKKSGVVVSPSPKIKQRNRKPSLLVFRLNETKIRNTFEISSPSGSVGHRSYFTHGEAPTPSASSLWSTREEPALVAISRNAGLWHFVLLKKPGVVVSPSPKIKQRNRKPFHLCFALMKPKEKTLSK